MPAGRPVLIDRLTAILEERRASALEDQRLGRMHQRRRELLALPSEGVAGALSSLRVAVAQHGRTDRGTVTVESPIESPATLYDLRVRLHVYHLGRAWVDVPFGDLKPGDTARKDVTLEYDGFSETPVIKARDEWGRHWIRESTGRTWITQVEDVQPEDF